MEVIGLLAAVVILGFVAAWGVRQDEKRRQRRAFKRVIGPSLAA